MNRIEIFNLLNEQITDLQKGTSKPVRIAINGIEGSGKTTFAIAFTKYLNSVHKNAVHITIDGFHFNKSHRYRQGRDSAIGYYEDSYNEMAFTEKVLIASNNETPNYTAATHNLETDKYINLDPISIKNNAILITDGAYLFKEIYQPHWDLKVYLKVDFPVALERGIVRDEFNLGGKDAARKKFINRYHKASQIYIEENDPEKLADIIIDNNDFENLMILKP